METSPEIKNIAAALLAFQEDAPSVTKDAKANYGKYATLGNVIDSTRAALAANNLSFMQFPDGDGLTTLIMHTSGEWVRATGKLILDKQTAQGLGSALTYGRRYALTAALGIAADDDDDGAHAVAAPQTAKKTPPPSVLSKAELSKADTDTVKALLAQLGISPKTVAEAQKAVLNATGYEFVPENYAQIVFTLEEKIEASK